MESLLIVYASTHGHTGKIAERLAEMLRRGVPEVSVHQAEKHDDLDPSPFDGVIVMASIHAERHQSSIARWVKANAGTLNERQSAFISVSLSTASEVPEVLAGNLEKAKAFADEAGWQPGRIELVAGCLQYPAYSFLTRFLMKRLARKQGLPLDTSRDHEYTDWDALEQFAQEFVSPAGGSSPGS